MPQDPEQSASLRRLSQILNVTTEPPKPGSPHALLQELMQRGMPGMGSRYVIDV